MTLNELLQALAGHGIKLSVEGDRLAVDSPTGEIPGALREQLVANKAALLTLLSEQRMPQAETLPQITPRPEERHAPFPMTEIQQAYSVGRQAELEMNAAMHAYNEIDCHALDLARFEDAWNLLIARHEMLRVVALPGFQQRILPDVPRYVLPVEDLRGREQEETEARFQAIRERLSQQVLALDQWPLFELRVCQLDGGRSRLFMSIDGTFIDGYSFQILYRELVHLYKHLGGAPALPNWTCPSGTTRWRCSMRAVLVMRVRSSTGAPAFRTSRPRRTSRWTRTRVRSGVLVSGACSNGWGRISGSRSSSEPARAS